MKKLFIIFSLLVMVAMAQAQVTIANLSDKGANNITFSGEASDTVGTTNGGQLTLYKLINAKSLTGAAHVSFTVSLTRISGNVAGHTVKFQGSVDGTNYVDINSNTLSDAASVVYSYTTQDTLAFVYPIYRVLLTSDGVGIEKLTSFNAKIVKK